MQANATTTDGYIKSKRECRRIQKDREQEEKDLLAVSFSSFFFLSSLLKQNYASLW